MAGIKETPTNFRVYYTSMKSAYTQKKEDALAKQKELIEKKNTLHKEVADEFEAKGEEYGINLNDYKEFTENKYINGRLFRVAKGYLINKSGDYELVGSRFNLYALAEVQKDIEDLEKQIDFADKMLGLSVKDYTKILKTYFNEVHKKLIIDGYGYSLGGRLGWICFNRCHLTNVRPHIDYKATKENKKRLISEGKRIYNKEEAEWCMANGIEYDGVDPRVYQNLEYVYEIPLLSCTITDGSKMRFDVADYYGRSIRGKSNQQLLEECNYDKNKICELDADVKLKLDLCLEADKILYTKFIRNENQETIIATKTNRKGRQRLQSE